MPVAQAEKIASSNHCGMLAILLAIVAAGGTYRLSYGEVLS